MIEVFEEKIEILEQKEEELYKEVIKAANYVSEHSMMHYDGRYETTELFLHNEQAERRLEGSLSRIEDIREELENTIDEVRAEAISMGSSPRYVEKARENAEDILEDFEAEIEHIREAREATPEERADDDYVESKEEEAKTLAERMDYTPKRQERP